MERNRLKEMQITEESGMELRSEVKQTATTGSRNEDTSEGTSMDTGTCQQLRIEVIKKLKEMGIELEVLNQYSPDDEMKQRQQEEIECPTPLLVVKPAIQQQLICCKDKETEEEGRHSLINNDNRMVIQYITQETRFGISPFALGMTHQDALVEGQLALQMVLREVRAKDMMRTWYVHMFPDEIQIRGKLLKQIFQGEADIDTTMEAVVRLYTELDNDMYSKWNGKRWRHFLPTEFAVWALNNERTETTMRIKEMFSSTFIDYKVADCRLVMVPVMVHWHWTLYVWDFKRNTVVILDPRGKEYDIHYMEHKHNKTFKMIHSAMQECHEKFLNESSNYMEDWGVQYITINGGQTESFDSGLYTMFSAKYFDGEIVTRLLTKEALQLQRVNLLYQILTMKGNIGTAPKGIEAALSL